MPDTSKREAGMEEAVAEYMRRVDAGETVDREAFIGAHPDAADGLRSYFDMEREVHRRAGAPDRVAAGPNTSTHSQARRNVETVVPGTAPGGAALPEVFGRYRVLRALGSGAMGTVYLAEDTELGRRVALKTANFHRDPSGEMLERFRREARSAANLRHSNICPVYDVGEIDGRHFISMAFLEGQSLSAYIKPGKPLPEKQALLIVRKLALALQEAHDAGIVHRDLKPGNVMIDSKGEPIITDFGLARMSGHDEASRLTQSGTIIGSPAYMSPEQVEGNPERISGASDQYSLGVILFEMMTGDLPFRGAIATIIGAILTKPPPPFSQYRTEFDPRIESLCRKMMSKSPEDRYPSLKGVAAEAANILKTPGSSSAEAPVLATPTVPLADDKPAPVSPKPLTAPKSVADVGGASVRATQGAARTAPQKPAAAKKVERMSAADLASMAAIAKKCLVRRDYDQVIQMLDDIPQNQRTEEITALLDKARSLSDEIVFLLTEIDEAVRRNDGDTAVRKADELLRLKPGHHRAKEVQEEYGGYGPGGKMRLGRGGGGGFRGEKTGFLWPAVGVGVTVFALMLWSVIVYLRVGDAVVQVTINDPDVKVGIQGRTLNITSAREAVKVDAGEKTLTITYGDLEFQSDKFTLKSGQNPIVVVERLDDKLAAKFGELGIGEWKVPGKSGAPAAPATAVAVGGSASSGGGSGEKWQTFFDSTDLSGWTPLVGAGGNEEIVDEGWTVRDGVLTCETDRDGWLRSPRQWGDFELRFEFKLPRGANSGVFVRRQAAGMEIQLEDDPTQKAPHQRTGAIYGFVAPTELAFIPEQWNAMTIRCVGEQVTVALNDKRVLDVSMDRDGLRGLPRSGHIGIYNWSGRAKGSQFRNVRLKELPQSLNVGSPSGPSPAVAAAPFDAAQARAHQAAWAKHLGVPVEYTNSIGMKFVLIPPGTYARGSTQAEIDAAMLGVTDQYWIRFARSEGPQHTVELTRPFYLGVNEVTQGNFSAVLNRTPSNFSPTGRGAARVVGVDTLDYPVEIVSWHEAVEFCTKLSEQENLKPFTGDPGEPGALTSGTGYRLPTEAEWEFAARAGTEGIRWSGPTDQDALRVAWLSGNSDSHPHKTGSKEANPFGLYDIIGNVSEWVRDAWASNYPAVPNGQKGLVDPDGGGTGPRIFRGASWNDVPSRGRSAYRISSDGNSRSPYVGFRVVLAIDAKRPKSTQ